MSAFSRAFVHMRTVTTPAQDRRGGASKTGRCDGVARTGKSSGTAPWGRAPQARNHDPEVPEEEQAAALATGQPEENQ